MLLGAALLVSYIFLPFVTQPELGPSTFPAVNASRDANEFDLETNGAQLILFAAGITLLAGVWGLTNRQLDRAVAAVTALGGVLVLEYFAVFFLSYRADEGTYLGAMGLSFWLMLALGAVMILQFALPRAPTPPEYRLNRLLANQESVVALALVALFVIVGLNNPRFLAERNLLDILQGNAYIAVAAIGMSMVIITGNIDISIGSLIGLLAIISGRLVVNDVPVIVAWLVPLVVGGGVGAVIGLLVAYLRIPSIVVTLGDAQYLKRHLDYLDERQTHHGDAGSVLPGAGAAFRVPMSVYFMVVLTLLAALWLRYSGLGASVLRARRERRSGAALGFFADAVGHAGVYPEWGLCRNRRCLIRHAAQRDSADAASKPRALRYHCRCGRWGQHFRW